MRPWLACVFLLIVGFLNPSSAQGNLLTEPAMNPGDTATADVLRDGEWSYNQPLIPAPGWMRWGVTENLTLQLDFTAWIFGVPSANFRYQFFRSADRSTRISLETMYVYFVPNHPSFQDFNKDDKYLFISRKGDTGFSKLNLSTSMGHRWIFHGSLGASYSRFYEVKNENREEFHGRVFENLWDPIAAVAVEYRSSQTTAFHANLSYGETFFLMENRPRKYQAVYGGRFLPFGRSPSPIWKNLRFELNALFFQFPDAKEGYSLPLPIYPYVYWQWRY